MVQRKAKKEKRWKKNYETKNTYETKKGARRRQENN